VLALKRKNGLVLPVRRERLEIFGDNMLIFTTR
jgi:hypothetical protein